MARYRRSGRSRRSSRSFGRSRRRFSGRTRRVSRSARRRTGGRTVRIVIEQPSMSSLARPAPGMNTDGRMVVMNTPTKRGRF